MRSISVGIDARKAFEAAIALDILTGVKIDKHTLSFDYNGLTQNDALQRAVDNHKALTAAAKDETDDRQSYLLNYAASYLAVAIDELANDFKGTIPTPTPTPDTGGATVLVVDQDNPGAQDAIDAVKKGRVKRFPSAQAAIDSLESDEGADKTAS